ncbi:MAG: translation initiation factor [Clostridia bacterium]|nr:translation initiation factor [Clostridia bacterium]
MAKTRVFELAKELRVSNKELMDTMSALGIYTRSHMSVLENGEVIKVRNHYRKLRRAAKAAKMAEMEQAAREIPPEQPVQKQETVEIPEQEQEKGRAEARVEKQVQKEEHIQAQPPEIKEKVQEKAAEAREKEELAKERGAEKPQVRGEAAPAPDKKAPHKPPRRSHQGRPWQQRPATGEEAVKEGGAKPKGKVLHIPRMPEVERGKEQPEKRRERAPKVTHIPERDRSRRRFEQDEERETKLIRPSKPKPKKQEVVAAPKVVPHVVLSGSITVQELAKRIGKTAAEVIKKLISLGVMATINQEIDVETAAIVAEELGAKVEVKVEKPITELEDIEDAPESLRERPPVVTVMGHVDHGKTSLLDAIRHTNVTATEAGGITQHIGAYQVQIGGRVITFLDTPGHEAFTAMRARGAQVTDIAVLVVAADDGVMPQTVEAINHAKAAGVPIVVAINKIDRPDANPDRVKQQLTEYGLVPEEWGGDTVMVPVSALKKQGIEQLLEMILLVADMAELKANPDRPARGVVIEAKLDKGRGPVATMLIQKGTLRVGDVLVAGTCYGRVRAMVDDQGQKVKEAGPSKPVEVLGLSEVPEAGDIFQVLDDEKMAREIAEQRRINKRQEEMKNAVKTSLDEVFKKLETGEVKELNLVIKGDVQGSVEAMRHSLQQLSTDEVKVNIIHSGVGAITETDVMLAVASKAVIIGFNVRPDANGRKAAEEAGIEIRLYRVIYEMIDDVRASLSGLLEPEQKEVQLGRAEVRATFKVPKVGTVAGCMVLEGKMVNRAQVRVVRDGVVVYEGRIESLKRFKDDVREVAQGYECGIGLEKFNDIKEGDIIEAYTIEEIKRTL